MAPARSREATSCSTSSSGAASRGCATSSRRIQTDQYRLITREPEPPLVVQGGPGTGKTAVGLHRASYLLYAQRERLRRVLVIGPNPTFMEYVSHVLPTLGEESVEQRAVGELVDGLAVTTTDPPEVARLKGDARLAE